ncbi:hypothetical protein Slin15195_G099400 [Septoria linicola]|uniref:Uncharacterized protein n=1 Tax=Septoria linicola TaxID=215465 RepID=A0A9Q9B5C4_9PEZI|nr:hypothetical protein Slin15195_G099400 [Septoria linicola]
MTIAEFFWLSDSQFSTRLAQLNNEDLLKDDIHNCRTRHGGKFSAYGGVVGALPTLGISLIGTGIGLRRRNVVPRRLAMVHAELQKRGLDKHVETKSDLVIPAVGVGIGTAIAWTGLAPLADQIVGPLAGMGADAILLSTVEACGVTGEVENGIAKLVVEAAVDRAADEVNPEGKSAQWVAKMERVSEK